MRIILKNSDIFGAASSTLCLIHCIVTPLLFFVPFWWTGLNFIFIIVSFFAVYGSVKNTSRKIMKPLLWLGFIFLPTLIINEEIYVPIIIFLIFVMISIVVKKIYFK